MSTQTEAERTVDAALLDALDRMLDAARVLDKLDGPNGMARDLRAPIKAVTELIDWNRANPGWSERQPV